MTDTPELDPDPETRAHQIAHVAAIVLRKLTVEVAAEASAFVILEGDNTISAVCCLPLDLSPELVELWSSKLARELRALAEDIERGDTRAQLDAHAARVRERAPD